MRHEGWGGVNQTKLRSQGRPRQEDSLCQDREVREHGEFWHNWDVQNCKNGPTRVVDCGHIMLIQKSRRVLKVFSSGGLIRFVF